jgi:hypothetical protein
LGYWQHRNSLIRYAGILCFIKNHYLAAIAAYKEAFHVGLEGVDVKTVNRVLLEQVHFESSVSFSYYDVALVSAYQDSEVRQPAVGRVILTDV